MNTTIITSFVTDHWSSEEAARPALSLEDETTWTYAELHEHSNRYANRLQGLGVQRGDRVAMVMFNSLEYWALYLAITRIGAVAVRVNFRLSPEELCYVLDDAGCRVVCFSDGLAPVIGEIRPRLVASEYVCFSYEEATVPPWAKSGMFMDEASSAEPLVPVPPSEDDPAMLMYTSGTTGRPKGAVWTHANTLWFGAMQAMSWKYDHSTVAMTSGPLYHVGAFEDLLLPALIVRGHAVMTRSRGFSIVRLAKTLESLAVTDVLLYPFMIYDLLQQPELAEFRFPHLRRIVTGGSPIVTWAVRELRSRLPGVELIQTYGLTEGGGITSAMPDGEGWTRTGSVGRPLPFTEVQIVDDGRRVPLGEIGEVLVRSPSVSTRYWEKPTESADTFRDGWCYTGDLGRMEEGGFMTITGRKKDMIKSGGENIYPAELELVLAEHPAVQEAAVIGVPDANFLEAVCAVVVPKPGARLTQEDVVAHCRQHLASYKKPRHVVCVDALPKTASGKVQKYLLREKYASLGEERRGPVPG